MEQTCQIFLGIPSCLAVWRGWSRVWGWKVHAPSWYQTWTWSSPRCGRSLCERAGQQESNAVGPGRLDLKKNKKMSSYLSRAADHDVVTVAVSNAQDVGGNTVACTWQSELLDGSIKSVAVGTRFTQITFRTLFSETLEMLHMQVLKGSFHHQTASYPEFLSLSQLSKASLLKAAAAAILLLVSWMLAIVSADETTSISPARSPVARQPYGTILHNREMHRKKKKKWSKWNPGVCGKYIYTLFHVEQLTNTEAMLFINPFSQRKIHSIQWINQSTGIFKAIILKYSLKGRHTPVKMGVFFCDVGKKKKRKSCWNLLCFYYKI